MKNFIILLFGFYFLFISKSPGQAMDTLQFADPFIFIKSKPLAIQYINLTEAEKSAFLPMVEKYDRDTQHLEMECLFLLSNYTQNFDHLSAKQTEAIYQRIIDNDALLAKFRKIYFKKFRKALSAGKASMYLQLETTFRTQVRMDMLKDLPPLNSRPADVYTKNQ